MTLGSWQDASCEKFASGSTKRLKPKIEVISHIYVAIPGSQTNPALTAARFLLKPGRKYEEAVKTFEPYDRVKEPNDDARAAGKKLIAASRTAAKRQAFIYVNNRLEGNALETIAAM